MYVLRVFPFVASVWLFTFLLPGIVPGGGYGVERHRETEHPDFLRGTELLSQAQFKAALAAFDAATDAVPENELYVVERNLLSRVVETRAAIQKERSLLRWTAQAKLLRSYYQRKGLFKHLIDMDTRIYERQSTPINAMLLAESYVLAGQVEEAVAILNQIEAAAFPAPMRPQLLIVRAGVLVAMDDREGAHRILKTVEINTVSDPGVLYRFAVMCAEVGLNRKAVQALSVAFRQTPVCFLGGMKERAKKEPAFQSVLASNEFAAALRVRSAVASPLCERNLQNLPDQNAKGAKPVVGNVDLNQWNPK